MDAETRGQLRQLIERGQYAALGTLQDGAPFVSMVLYAATPDLTNYFVHISSLALHTQNLLADPLASLMILDPVGEGRNPQTLARVSMQGQMRPLGHDDEEQRLAQGIYLGKFPEAEGNFALADFKLFVFRPKSARLVAGFGRIFDMDVEDLARLAEASD